MPMLNAVRRIFFHLCQYIADNFWVFGRFRAGTTYYGEEGELRPCESVVKVVFEEVVFGQVAEIALLDRWEQGDM